MESVDRGHRRTGVAASWLLGLVGVLAGCGGSPSPADRVILERSRFAVQLVSWAPLEDGRMAVDLQVDVRGESDLQILTVEIRQVGPGEAHLRTDLVPLDVAGMRFDDRRHLTAHVPSAGVEVVGVAVVLETPPPGEARASYPEFTGT